MMGIRFLRQHRHGYLQASGGDDVDLTIAHKALGGGCLNFGVYDHMGGLKSSIILYNRHSHEPHDIRITANTLVNQKAFRIILLMFINS